MAFLAKNLSLIAFGNGVGLYHYESADDSLATISGSGYFAAASGQLKVDDFIIANGSDTSGMRRVTAVSPAVTTANAVSATLTQAATEAALTDNSGGAAADGTIAAVNDDGICHLSIPIALAGVTDGDVVTSLKPGVVGTIEHVQFVVTTRVTTAAKATTLNLEIGTTNLTGGTVALTSSNCGTLGAVIENGAAPSANNVLAVDSLLSVEAASTTQFSEGAGLLVIRIKRASTAADAIKELATKVNALTAKLISSGVLASS